jgi:hypothetical protein
VIINAIIAEATTQYTLGDLARDIALIEPIPVDWGGWVSYLLEQLEAEAQSRLMHVAYLYDATTIHPFMQLHNGQINLFIINGFWKDLHGGVVYEVVYL